MHDNDLVAETIMVTRTYWVAPDGRRAEIKSDRDLESAKAAYVQRVCDRLGLNGLYTRKEKFYGYYDNSQFKKVDIDTILKIADMIHCDKLAANSKG